MSFNLVDYKSSELLSLARTVETPLSTGEVHCLSLRSDPEQLYYLYLPANVNSNTKIFVSVHGISRNAESHARRNIKRAEKRNVVIVAPLFTKQRFPDYQRLGRTGGLRADYKLLDILDEVKEKVGLNAQRFYLFGYSGGGQFVHRFAMAHPDKVARVAIGAAGWYTPPNECRRFPYGLRSDPKLPDLHFDIQKIVKIPACVIVGELDKEWDDQLRLSEKIIKRQGKTRIERGRNWINKMQEKARQYQRSTPYEFHLLPNAGHSYRQCMREGKMGGIVFRFLFGPLPELITNKS